MGQNDDCRWLQVSDQKAINGWLRNEGNAVELQVPCTEIPPGTYRPPTGLLISVQGTRAGTKLESIMVKNLMRFFILTDLNDQLIVSAYVRNGENFTISKIYDGLYYFYYTTGTDWNGTIFTKNASYRRYETSFDFSTVGASEETNYYYTYRVYNINLPVRAGLTKSVSADQFPKPTK